MVRYSDAEDLIIVRNLKQVSRAGSPLNIQAALADARVEIRKTLKIKRTQASVSMRWYNTLRKEYKVWGYGNLKNRLVKSVTKTILVTVGGRKFRLDANLRPQVISHLQKIAK